MHKKDLSGQAKYLGVMSLKDFILYFYNKKEADAVVVLVFIIRKF